MAARAFAKIKVHKNGGAANSQYIGSVRELSPRELDREEGHEPPGRAEPDELDRELREDAAPPGPDETPGRGCDDRDRVWGWNVPGFVADDGHGVWETPEGRALLASHSLTLTAQHLGLGPAPPKAERLSAVEKRENLVAHLSAMADLEERRGGLSHFRLILSVGREVTLERLKDLVRAYLREHFPLCPALVAVHDDTNHRHAHVYVHARQLHGRLLDLGQDYFKLDEGWMKVCAEGLGDPKIYEVHMELKGQTLGWKEGEKTARERGEAIPPKPDRWGDHHDTLLVFRPFDDRWCGRLRAQVRVAEIKAAWLEASRAESEEVTAARDAAAVLRERLDSAAERRSNSRRETKRQLPAEVITVGEARELKGYERDLREVEQAKETILRETGVPEKTSTQAVLSFDEPVASQEVQTAFNFESLPGREQPGEGSRAAALIVREPLAGDHETDELLKSTMPGASPSSDDAGRILGRELVAEARLAYIEVRLRAERSRQAQTELKGDLLESRREHERAHQAAEICRATLTAQGTGEPPYQLSVGERGYLTFVSPYVSDPLRERIVREVDRAQIISDRVEVGAGRAEDSVPRDEVKRTEQTDVGARPVGAKKRQAPAVENTERNTPAPEQNTTGRLASPQPPTMPAMASGPRTLTDEEAGRLVVDLELARARAIFLRSGEREFAAMPHRWVSPASGMSLDGVEQQISERLKQKKEITDLVTRREQLQRELAAERRSLPQKLAGAESAVEALGARLAGELSAREAAGMPAPEVRFGEQQLHELMGYAEASRDTGLLERVYKIESAQAMDDARATGDPEIVRRFEEKYVGLEFKAEVGLHREEKALAWARKHPTEMLLPDKDDEGRDVATSLARYEPRKGLRGVLGKLTAGQGRRELRDRLEAAKESHLRRREGEVEIRSAYLEALGSITKNCRELSRECGYRGPAAPGLTEKEIAEIHAYAVRQPQGVAKAWLNQCAHAQALHSGWSAKPYRTRESDDKTTPQPEVRERTERIQKQLQEGRQKEERMVRLPSQVVVPRETPAPGARERNDHDKTGRSGRGGR